MTKNNIEIRTNKYQSSWGKNINKKLFNSVQTFTETRPHGQMYYYNSSKRPTLDQNKFKTSARKISPDPGARKKTNHKYLKI